MKDEGGGMKDEGGGMKDEGGIMKEEGLGMGIIWRFFLFVSPFL